MQHQILEVLRELEQRTKSDPVMLITHDISVVAQVCDSVAVMYAGRIVEQAAAEPFFACTGAPLQPRLAASFPESRPSPRDVLVSIEGYPPDLRESLQQVAALPSAAPSCRTPVTR